MRFAHRSPFGVHVQVLVAAFAVHAAAAPINVWYGTSQTFGAPGVAQRWINVLGDVDEPIGAKSLWYTALKRQLHRTLSTP